MNQTTNDDANHLKILSICFYVKAGLVTLTSLIFSIYIILGLVFMSVDIPRNAGEPPPQMLGGIFVVFGVALMAFFLLLAGLVFWAGRSISKRQNYTFILIIAGLMCLSMPLGTILGVFTFIVLMRDSVKGIFNGTAAPQFGASPPNWQ